MHVRLKAFFGNTVSTRLTVRSYCFISICYLYHFPFFFLLRLNVPVNNFSVMSRKNPFWFLRHDCGSDCSGSWPFSSFTEKLHLYGSFIDIAISFVFISRIISVALDLLTSTGCLFSMLTSPCARKTSLSPPPPVIHYWPFQGGGSGVVSVSCFGVRVSVMFHLCLFIILSVQFWLLSGHLLGNSCPLG